MQTSKPMMVFVLLVVLIVTGAWLTWPRDPAVIMPEASSKVEPPSLSRFEMAEPPRVEWVAQIKPPRNPTDSTAIVLDTSEWARRFAARGDRRDLEAVIETFQESMQCHHYHDAVAYLQVISENPRNKDLGKLNLRDLEELNQDMARRQAIIDRASALCKGSDRIAVNRAYQRAMLDAALRGDPNAQTCFLKDGGDTRYWDPQEYQQLVGYSDTDLNSLFTKAGLERADPYVGYLEISRYMRAIGLEPLPTTPSEPSPDIVRVWEVARLASLRAPPYLRSMTEDMLNSVAERALISPEDIERADAWAQATWEKEFADEPPFDFGRYGACSPQGWH